MVATGARVNALRTLMLRLGRTEMAKKPLAPRLTSLPPETARDVMALYRTLGGFQIEPKLAPGSWDVVYADGLIVELDEDMHFDRYRAVTLDAPWAPGLPWTAPYRRYVEKGEFRAGFGGRRWTNPSTERMFGTPDPDGCFGANGAPRWKQRALYDAMKDAAAATGQVALARISIYDEVGGHVLNDVLKGRASVELETIDELVAQRTSG